MSEQKPDDSSTPDMASFLASSVHDMKNSVSILINGLDKTLSSADAASFPSYTGLVQMNYEAKRINDKLVQLLALYKLGQKSYPFDPQFLPLNEFLQNIATLNTDLLKSQEITLEIHVDPDLHWYFDEDLVNGVIGNALNNATRYAVNKICLSAKENNGILEIHVEDDGGGFSNAVLEESIGSMRNINFQSRNTGLGIYFSSIVAKLHRNHGKFGKVKLENGGSLGGGCFILYIP